MESITKKLAAILVVLLIAALAEAYLLATHSTIVSPTNAPLFQQTVYPMTTPNLNFTLTTNGELLLMSSGWYGGLQPYTANFYNGTSPICALDTTLFQSNKVIYPPYPGGYNPPNQKYVSTVLMAYVTDPQVSQLFGYYCVNVTDSQGTTLNSTAVLLDSSYLPSSTSSSTTTFSVSTTSTIPTTTSTTSSTSTMSTTPSTASTSSSTTVPASSSGSPSPTTTLSTTSTIQNPPTTTIQPPTAVTNSISCGCICSGTCVHKVNSTSTIAPAKTTTTLATTTAPTPSTSIMATTIASTSSLKSTTTVQQSGSNGNGPHGFIISIITFFRILFSKI